MRFVWIFSICLLGSTSLTAQCDRLLQLSREALAARNYQLAIERLLDTRDVCPEQKDVVNQLIQQAFQQIEGEKQLAMDAQQQAETERQAAEKLRQREEGLRKRADSALSVAARVLDQLYFYEGKFGLTLKDLGNGSLPKYRYGFIDRTGKTVIPFLYEQATPFSAEDGFARVQVNQEKYLLDTTGMTYELAESVAELTPTTRALDLTLTATDTLPTNLGAYPQLRVLLLKGDSFRSVSSLPHEKLTELPSSITQLSKLTVLAATYLALSKLPQDMGKLTALQRLDLHRNVLDSLPISLGQLKQLEYLDVSFNRFEELPSSIPALENLKVLDLKLNDLLYLPENFHHLSQLETLNITGNASLEYLPDSFGLLINLTSFEKTEGVLRELPANFGQLQSLEELILYNNSIYELPESFGQLHNLKTLYISGNKLYDLPASFTQLKNLEKLSIGRNPLGKLPDDFGLLRNLKSVSLDEAELEALPISFAQLSKLESLGLEMNPLQELPPFLCEIPEVRLDPPLQWELIDTCPELTPDSLSASELWWIAETYIDQQEYAQAYPIYQLLTQRDSRHFEYWYKYSRTGLFIQKQEEAISTAQQILESMPEHTSMNANLALGYVLNGQYDLAEPLYLRWKDKTFHQGLYPARRIFLYDIRKLEEKGITHPDFDKVRALLNE